MLAMGHSFKEMAKREAEEAKKKKERDAQKRSTSPKRTLTMDQHSDAGNVRRRKTEGQNSNLSDIDVQSVAMSAPVKQNTKKLKQANIIVQPTSLSMVG